MAKEEKAMTQESEKIAASGQGDDIASLKKLLAEQQQQINRLLTQQLNQQPVNANLIVPDKAKEEKDRYDLAIIESDERIRQAEELLSRGKFFIRIALFNDETVQRTGIPEPWNYGGRPMNPWRVVGVNANGETGKYEARAKYDQFFGITAVAPPAKQLLYYCHPDGSPILDAA